MFDRLRGDFQLASMLLFTAVACPIILAFAAYRASRGDWGIATFDLLVVSGFIAAVAYAWRTRRYAGPVLVILTVLVVGSIGITWMMGRAGIFWSYPALLVSFFIATKQWALAANVILVVAIAFMGKGFVGDFERFSYLATAGLVTLLSFLFAHRAAQHRDQLEALASFDPLTRAGNRRLMEQDLAQATSAGGHHGLVVLDLDHFKLVNDEHGHEAGDRVLVEFADLVRAAVRKSDRLYRFGGEEFVLLLPSPAADGLAAAAEKIRTRVAGALRSPGGPVTVSIGAALLAPGEDWPTWLARADAALYRAKHEGRNRVVLADSPLPDGGSGDRRQAGYRG